jgi:hypothetical protein
MNKFDLYVVRILDNGQLSNSKPCKNCILELKKYCLIKRIYYVDWNGQIVSEKFSNITTDYQTAFDKN